MRPDDRPNPLREAAINKLYSWFVQQHRMKVEEKLIISTMFRGFHSITLSGLPVSNDYGNSPVVQRLVNSLNCPRDEDRNIPGGSGIVKCVIGIPAGYMAHYHYVTFAYM